MSVHPEWTASAACADRSDLPWTIDAADATPWQAETMRAVCRTCPAVLDCLAAVDDLDVTGGWWAGADRDPHAVPTPHPAFEWLLVWVPVRTKTRGVVAAQAAFDFAGDTLSETGAA